MELFNERVGDHVFYSHGMELYNGRVGDHKVMFPAAGGWGECIEMQII